MYSPVNLKGVNLLDCILSSVTLRPTLLQVMSMARGLGSLYGDESLSFNPGNSPLKRNGGPGPFAGGSRTQVIMLHLPPPVISVYLWFPPSPCENHVILWHQGRLPSCMVPRDVHSSTRVRIILIQPESLDCGSLIPDTVVAPL